LALAPGPVTLENVKIAKTNLCAFCDFTRAGPPYLFTFDQNTRSFCARPLT
jgi:hypothetical protein